MEVSATFNDTNEYVTIVDIGGNGNDIYVTYVTSADELKVRKRFYPLSSNGIVIATSAVMS